MIEFVYGKFFRRVLKKCMIIIVYGKLFIAFLGNDTRFDGWIIELC